MTNIGPDERDVVEFDDDDMGGGTLIDEDEYCDRCLGSGFILVCWDDICVARGECIHGDGEIACPDCTEL